MNSHALHVLDYPVLLEYLSNYTTSEVTRQLILNLKPETDYKLLNQQLAELAEFRYLRSSGQDIPDYSGPKSELFKSIHSSRTIGWRLQPVKIYAIGDVLTKASLLRLGILKLEDIPLLKTRVKKLILLPELRNRIMKTVNHKGEVEDRASQELARIRRKIRKYREKIRENMENLASSLHKQGALQDPIVTIRDGRLVLPVRAGFSREVPGVIHDRSSSGSTFFIEPKASVEDNIALGKLENEEFQEINRILTDITALIGEKADVLLENLEIVIQMDFIQAKAKFCDEIGANPVHLCKTPMANLKETRNPLLVLHRLYSTGESQSAVVPIDLNIDENSRILVITGPNTGGKTVALKTLGLTVLMVQTGIHPICSDTSTIGIFTNIYADIGDEQSLEQNLSTFSSHVKQIIEIINNADYQSLILLDELGAGTDPTEGSALGIAILSELLRKNTWAIANTHHNSIKAFAFTTMGIANAAMEFDIRTLKPTYRILMGRIGQSNALDIASRLGFPDRLLAEARQHIEGKTLNLQEMLDRVEKSRISAEKQISKAINEKSRAKELRKAREDVLKRAEKQASEIIEKATAKSQRILAELMQERRELKADIKKVRRSMKSEGITVSIEQDEMEKHGKKLRELSENVNNIREEILADQLDVKEIKGKIQEGDTVWIKRFQVEAVVLKKESESRFLVDMGGKRIRVTDDSIKKIKSARRKKQGQKHSGHRKDVQVTVETVSMEAPELRLNLIGKRVDDAVDDLHRYMNQIIKARVSQVTVIHGFGTGRLQNAVVKYLKQLKEVSRARSGTPAEGGGGVTVVEMDLES